MDMISIRRKLMARMQSDVVNTSPRIAEYNKYCGRGNVLIQEGEGFCYTDWYDVNPVSTTSVNMIGQNVAPGTQQCFQYLMSNNSRDWDYFPNRAALRANTIQVRFTLYMDKLADCYVYINQTGQILFAGRNTPYYGYTNINDMPTGTQ